MGTGARAYSFGSVKDNSTVRYGNRDQNHSAYLHELINKGYLPHEWITFVHRNLSRTQALSLEKILIKEQKPRFNKKHGLSILKFNTNDLHIMFKLREEGRLYHEIASKMGCSVMTTYRILNNKNPRYKELLDGRI